MQEYTIKRSGIPNLDFTGEIIGQSGVPKPSILIYRTNTQKFVAQVQADEKYSQAESFESVNDLIGWFKRIYGRLLPAVEDAIEDAATRDEAFKTFWNQHV